MHYLSSLFLYLYYVTFSVDGTNKKHCAVNNIPVKKKFHLSQVTMNCIVVHARIRGGSTSTFVLVDEMIQIPL